MGAAPWGRQDHALGMTPGPPLPPLSALGCMAVERGVEKMNRRVVMRGLRGSGSRRADGARACWAAACELGREAEQAWAARPSPLFFSFLFSFSTSLI